MSDCTTPDERIRDLVRQFAPGLPAEAARAREANLHDAGLTSMATVRLMLAIEAAYGLAIPDAELTPENFRSIVTIEALIARLQAT